MALLLQIGEIYQGIELVMTSNNLPMSLASKFSSSQPRIHELVCQLAYRNEDTTLTLFVDLAV